jgi:hypothetical protein
LNRSQNGFGCGFLIELARRVNNHLGAMKSRQRRDSRHYLPSKPDEERIGDAGRLAVHQRHSLSNLDQNQHTTLQKDCLLAIEDASAAAFCLTGEEFFRGRKEDAKN